MAGRGACARSRPTCTRRRSRRVSVSIRSPSSRGWRMPTDHGRAAGLRAAEIQIAAGVDGEIARAARARARPDRSASPLATAPRSSTSGRRAVIVRRDRIEAHVAVARAPRRAGAGSTHRAGAIVAVETARFHVVADRRIERAAGLLGHRDRETARPRTGCRSPAPARRRCAVSCISSLPASKRVQRASTSRNHVERALDPRPRRHRCSSATTWIVTTVPIATDGADHFALLSASTTA